MVFFFTKLHQRRFRYRHPRHIPLYPLSLSFPIALEPPPHRWTSRIPKINELRIRCRNWVRGVGAQLTCGLCWFIGRPNQSDRSSISTWLRSLPSTWPRYPFTPRPRPPTRVPSAKQVLHGPIPYHTSGVSWHGRYFKIRSGRLLAAIHDIYPV